jgi:hypothetical protein
MNDRKKKQEDNTKYKTHAEKTFFSLLFMFEKKLKSVSCTELSKGMMYVVKINPETQSAKSVSKKLLRSVWARI